MTLPAMSTPFDYENEHGYGINTDEESPKKPEPMNIYPIWWMNDQRSRRINELLETDESIVCIYGQSDNVPARLKLEQAGAIEKHLRYIRALVSLSQGGS